MSESLTLAIERFPLAEYVRSHGAWEAGRDELMLQCPYCLRDKLSVNLDRRAWRCFICERYQGKSCVWGGGGIFQLVKWLERLSGKGTAEFLLNTARPQPLLTDHLPDPKFNVKKHSRPEQLLPTGLPRNTVAIDGTLPYMKERGITIEDARAYGLGYCTSGWVEDRIIFPVWEQGQCVFWQARATWERDEHERRHPGEKFRKTLNPSRTRLVGGVERHYYGSGDVLLNLEQAARHPRVVITEGPTSCIRVGADAVATFGKQLQPQQIAKLVSAGVRAVDFMWDGPSEKEPMGAWVQMMQSASLLASFMDVRLVFLPAGDPGDYTRAELHYFRSVARPFSSMGDTI